MAVDIKSLRIGSHILVNGVRARVSKIINPPLERVMPGIGLLHFNTVIDGNICECGCPVCADGIEPIAITPELLKELGLNVISHGCSEHWFLGNFDLTHNTDSCYWDYEGDIRVGFLHELEDLYYLKYGVELIPD